MPRSCASLRCIPRCRAHKGKAAGRLDDALHALLATPPDEETQSNEEVPMWSRAQNPRAVLPQVSAAASSFSACPVAALRTLARPCAPNSTVWQ